MVSDITVPAKRCTCERCGHRWIHFGDKLVPQNCANNQCRSREWNGKKLYIRSHANEIKFPAPRQGGRPRTITLFEDEE